MRPSERYWIRSQLYDNAWDQRGRELDGSKWRPLFDRDSQESTEWDVLHEGVPEWLEGSIWRWLMDRAAEGGPALVSRMERRLHKPLASPGERAIGVMHPAPNELLEREWRAGQRDPERRLELLDALLVDMQVRARAGAEEDDPDKVLPLIAAAEVLEEILHEGGSAWRAQVAPPT